jgi:arylsulfatase A
LLPLLTKGEVPKRDTFYPHYPAETGKWENRMSSVIRQGNFKLIEFYARPRLKLYDLKADPSETKDLSTAMPGKVKAMKEMLDIWKKEVKAVPAILAEK